MKRVQALLVAAAGLSAACAPTDLGPTNVLLVTVDTLRADHLSCYGYERETSPRIDGLAARATRYANAYSPAPWTRPAVGSILTGWYPSAHTFDRVDRGMPAEVPTLAEHFAGAGYATAMVNSNVLLRKKTGLAQGFEEYFDKEARGHAYVSTPGITRLALKQLDQRAKDGRPFFLSLLYFDPHYDYLDHEGIDYANLPTGRIESGQKIHRVREWGPDLTEAEIGALRDLYDEEIRFTDAGIGQVLDHLGKLGLDRTTAVVLTADHGEEFFEHGWLGHTRNLYDNLLHVPLIVREPGQTEGRVVESPVTTVSIAATLDRICELDAGEGAFQAAALPLANVERPVDLFAEVNFFPLKEESRDKRAQQRSLRRGTDKLIFDELADRRSLFDLAVDPGEFEDRAAERAELVSELSADLDLVSRGIASGGVAAADLEELSEEEKESLRALGYLGGN